MNTTHAGCGGPPSCDSTSSSSSIVSSFLLCATAFIFPTAEGGSDPSNGHSGFHLICLSLHGRANQYIYQASYLSRSNAFRIEHF